MKTDKDVVEVPRALLQAARDYIGSMPTLDSMGNDRFLDALQVVDPIEGILRGDSTTPEEIERWKSTFDRRAAEFAQGHKGLLSK